jgi:hypothetical protein
MCILILWITFYGNIISPTISVNFNSIDECVHALSSLEHANDNNVTVQGYCEKK